MSSERFPVDGPLPALLHVPHVDVLRSIARCQIALKEIKSNNSQKKNVITVTVGDQAIAKPSCLEPS